MKSAFRIVVEKATSNYSAYSPDLPGCIATGKTIKQVKHNMKAAIRAHIESSAEEMPRRKPQVQLSLSWTYITTPISDDKIT